MRSASRLPTEPGSEGRQGRRRLRRGKTGRRSERRRVFGVFRVCRVLTVVLARPVTSGHQPLPVLLGHGNQGSEPWRLSVTLEGLGVTLDESPNHLQGSAGGERRLHVSSAGGVEAVPSHVAEDQQGHRVAGPGSRPLPDPAPCPPAPRPLPGPGGDVGDSALQLPGHQRDLGPDTWVRTCPAGNLSLGSPGTRV